MTNDEYKNLKRERERAPYCICGEKRGDCIKHPDPTDLNPAWLEEFMFKQTGVARNLHEIEPSEFRSHGFTVIQGESPFDEAQIFYDPSIIKTQKCVLAMEAEYPEMTSMFKDIQQEQYELFCRKQQDYGSSNIAVGTQLKNADEVNLSLTGIWFRMSDKISRIKNLLLKNHTPNNEAITDSYLDVSNYGIMAMIVKAKKWGM